MKPLDLAGRLTPQAFSAWKQDLMQRVLFVALAAGQKRTPVRTGTLRRSETTRVESGGARGYLGTNVVYAPMVHARTPFFALGIDDARPAIGQELQRAGDDWAAKAAHG